MSRIQWTDETWNPTVGCTRVSPGCEHCYAETVARRGMQPAHRGLVTERGHWNGTVRLLPERLDQPLRWRKPRRVFVDSMSDLFHPEVPEEFIDAVFAVMALRPKHTFQVLTKRPERMRRYVERVYEQTDSAGTNVRLWNGILSAYRETGYKPTIDAMIAGEAIQRTPMPFQNVWLGTSVEDQKRADERIPHLLQTPAALRFLSVEPLLGPVDLHLADCWIPEDHAPAWDRIGWIIVDGEFGPGARPLDLAWARSIQRQCEEAEVPYFFNQAGCYVVDSEHRCGVYAPEDRRAIHAAKALGLSVPPNLVLLREPKGGDPSEWPEDLRVREEPRGGEAG